MAGISIAVSAAVVAAGITSVHGMYVQQERYALYYGNDISAHNFWTDSNPVLRAHPGARVRTLEPTVPEVTLLDRIDFGQRQRPVETRIYSGTLDVSDCYEGHYLFRVTSDDATHMFVDGKMVINNGGWHGPVRKTGSIQLKRGKKYDWQLWWGNGGGPAMAMLEYCHVSGGGFDASKDEDESGLLSVIRSAAGSIERELLDELTDEELALGGCVFTKDLSSIFAKHDVPTIKREDFDGYHWENLDFFKTAKVETKWLPLGYAHETGGVIGAKTREDGPEVCQHKSFLFSTPIAARVTGVHTFWVQSDDGAFLFVGDKKVVDNGGGHAPRWRRGTVHLKAGERKTLKLYYGNGGGPGMLDVRWQDHLAEEPLKSLLPIMVV